MIEDAETARAEAEAADNARFQVSSPGNPERHEPNWASGASTETAADSTAFQDAVTAQREDPPQPIAFVTQPLEPIMRFFKYDHLPVYLQPVSQMFYQLAKRIEDTIPRSAERTVGLRKILEGKDAIVRAAIVGD